MGHPSFILFTPYYSFPFFYSLALSLLSDLVGPLDRGGYVGRLRAIWAGQIVSWARFAAIMARSVRNFSFKCSQNQRLGGDWLAIVMHFTSMGSDTESNPFEERACDVYGWTASIEQAQGPG